MIFKGKVIGVLDLESPQLHYFTEEHVQTLTILAANLAVSLENARLYEQVARDEARMERDLQAAKRIQGALLRQCPLTITASTLRRAISPRARCAETSMIFCAMARNNWASRSAMSAERELPLRSMAPFRSASCEAWLRKKLQPAEMLRQMNQLVGERRIEGAS